MSVDAGAGERASANVRIWPSARIASHCAASSDMLSPNALLIVVDADDVSAANALPLLFMAVGGKVSAAVDAVVGRLVATRSSTGSEVAARASRARSAAAVAHSARARASLSQSPTDRRGRRRYMKHLQQWTARQ